MTRAAIAVGTGRYADRWHRYAETARCVRDLLSAQGIRVDETGDPDQVLARLDGDASLLVVMAGECADDGRSVPSPEAQRGLDRHLDAGRPVLALHSAASAFADYPRWESVIGARWVAGRSSHPPLGWGEVTVTDVAGWPDRRPLTFDVYDELYTDLRVCDDVRPWAWHDLRGERHPLVWTRDYGDCRVVYDGLGHDARSYGAPGHAQLLACGVAWLVGGGERWS